MLATLIKQLSGQQALLPDILRDLYEQKKKINIRPSLAEISKALAVVTASYSRIFIIVDALDEPADDSRRMLLSKIFDLQRNCKASLFATSRFITEIEDRFKGSIVKEIRAASEDIQRYLAWQVCGGTPGTAKERLRYNHWGRGRDVRNTYSCAIPILMLTWVQVYRFCSHNFT